MRISTTLTALLALTFAAASAQSTPPTLRVYGPGGPLSPMQEAAQAFGAQAGVKVVVVGGPRSQWIAQARQDADVLYEGGEYALRSFADAEPNLIDLASRQTIADRGAAILVRPGNPKNIRSVRDLALPGLRLLDVNGAGQVGMWEDLSGRYGVTPGVSRNIVRSYSNTADAIKEWNSNPNYDAWITFGSWGKRLPDTTQTIDIPPVLNVYRGTPVALSKSSTQKPLGTAFLAFLAGREGQAIFRKWGWR